MGPDRNPQRVAEILNAAWMVRHYRRGGSSGVGRKQRDRAIYLLGLVVRVAFQDSNDFEPLLAAIVRGLSDQDDKQPF